MPNLFIDVVEDKTQADGAQTVSLGVADRFLEHQIHLSVSATPTAGSLDVSIKTPGADGFVSIGSIDMTDSTKYLMQFKGFASEVRFTPSSFDADKTYTVNVCSGGPGI